MTAGIFRKSTLAFAIVAVLAGCGVKSAPLPPEMARPQRILNLRASAAAGGINLAWGRPTRYAGGHVMRDLSDFVILRGEGGGQMKALVEIPVTDQQRFQLQREFSYLDNETNIGERYRYAVISETRDGYRSLPSNEVDFIRKRPPSPPNPENFKLPKPPPLPAN